MDHRLEFRSDNGGSAYMAADTRGVARALGLKPINTPVCSPQSNSKGFASTFTRDYVAQLDLSDAATMPRSCLRPSSTSTRCIRTLR